MDQLMKYFLMIQQLLVDQECVAKKEKPNKSYKYQSKFK